MQMPDVQQTRTRRGFLKASFAVSLAGRASLAAPGGMFLSLNGSLLPTRPPWPEFVRLAGRIGYGGADLSLDAAMKEGVGATRALYSEARVRPGVAGFPIPLTADDAAFQAGLNRLPDVAAFLAAVECPRMQAVLYPSGDKPKD